MNKGKWKLSERQEAALLALAGVALALVISNTAHAQSIQLPFLDWIKNFFDSIRHHAAVPSVFAAFLIGSVLIYTKTHQLPALMTAIGCSVGIGVWVIQDSLLSSLGYNG